MILLGTVEALDVFPGEVSGEDEDGCEEAGDEPEGGEGKEWPGDGAELGEEGGWEEGGGEDIGEPADRRNHQHAHRINIPHATQKY